MLAIFEFSTFGKKDFEHGRDFVTQLDQFLGALPPGWRYAVELRNRGWLVPEYFAMLRSHSLTLKLSGPSNPRRP